MWSIISSIFLTSFQQITRDLKDAYTTKQNAKTEQERIAADERISTLEARKSIILSSQSDPMEKWIRILFALPCVVYVNKCVIWDNAFGLGVTDPLSSELNQFFWIVVGGYFIDSTVKGTARILKR